MEEDKENITNNKLCFCSHYDKSIYKLDNNQEVIQYAILPQFSSQPQMLSIPGNLNIIFLKDFITIIDELDSFKEFERYYLFKKEYPQARATDEIDVFASFKDSNSVLIEGAIKPDHISIISHWGDSYRFESLKDFWELYPLRNNYRHPRGWEIRKKYNRIFEMFNKQDTDLITFIRLNNTYIFSSVVMRQFNKTQFDITKLISDLLIYNIEKYYDLLIKDNFSSNLEILIKVFPDSLMNKQEYKHYHHLYPITDICKIEMHRIRDDFILAHVGYNEKQFEEEMTNISNRRIEVKFISEFLNALDNEIKINELNNIIQQIEKDEYESPSHTRMEIEIDYFYNGKIQLIKPDVREYKLAKNKISEILHNEGIPIGKFTKIDGKEVINSIKNIVLHIIEIEIANLEFESIYFFIEQFDCILHEQKINQFDFKSSLNREIAYNIKDRYSESNKEFRQNKNIVQFIIELFTNSNKRGNIEITNDKYKYIFSLTYWYFNLIEASEYIYYDLYEECTIEVDSDFLVMVNYPQKILDSTKNYSYQHYQLNSSSTFYSEYFDQESLNEFITQLDVLFKESYNFTIRNLIISLEILSEGNLLIQGKNYISHSKKELVELLSVEVPEEECESIINYLILERNKINTILTENGIIEIDYIPVLEHSKRHYRYPLRPILYDNVNYKYIVGTISAKKCAEIWQGYLFKGILPFITQNKKIDNCINEMMFHIQNKFVSMSFDKISSYNLGVILKERELNKFDPEGKHPKNLGDYDILLFSLKYNKILNIECKYLKPSYSIKDTKRDMEKIFIDNNKGSYIKKLERRNKYLKDNWKAICKRKAINFENDDKVVVIPIFLTIYALYWTINPRVKTNINFICYNQIDELCKSIIEDTKFL